MSGQQPGMGEPLVKITATPAGNDHPLAQSTVPIVQGREVTNNNVPSSPASRARPPATFSPPPTTTPTSSRPSSRITSAGVSPNKSLDSLADQFLSKRTDTNSSQQPMLRPEPLSGQEDEVSRLRTLVERRAWGDVLKVATGMLNSPKDPHADVYASLVTLPLNAPKADAMSVSEEIRLETVEIMTLQCHAWLKLRRYSDIATEVERWNFVTHHDMGAESPDWLPWSLHILAAQTQQHTDDPGTASDVLLNLRQRIPKEDSIWLVSVDNALTNLYMREGNWRLALLSLDRILESIPAAAEYELDKSYPNASDRQHMLEILISVYKCEVYSRGGRALLQIGALPEAEQRFERARQERDKISGSTDHSTAAKELENHIMIRTIPSLLSMNEGIMHFSGSDYDRAAQSFTQAAEQLRAGGTLIPTYRREDWMGPVVVGSDSRQNLYSEAINNIALCNLYRCKLEDAIDCMESLVRENPTAYLTERVAFNLATLYELSSDSAASARKKRVLQVISKRFFLHDIGAESFRIS